MRRNKSFQRVGGAAQLDEEREAVMPQRVVAGAQQVEDLVVIAEALLGGQVVEPLPNRLTANNRGERRWTAADQQLDDLGAACEVVPVSHVG